MDMRNEEVFGYRYQDIFNKADSISKLFPKEETATPPEDNRNMLFLTVIISDTFVTLAAKGGFLPSIYYREFHRYIAKNGLDTLVEYTPGKMPVNSQTGKEFTLRERIETSLYITERDGSVTYDYNRQPFSVFDELKNRLTAIRKIHHNAPDAGAIIITAENDVSFDKVIQFMNTARNAGYTISFAKLSDGSDSKLPEKTAQIGGRSRASIQRVVAENVPELRRAYNERLHEKPGIAGTITVNFAINEFGEIISVKITESTMNDPEFEKIVTDNVKNWEFEAIDKPGDITEITYPFVFSQ